MSHNVNRQGRILGAVFLRDDKRAFPADYAMRVIISWDNEHGCDTCGVEHGAAVRNC